MAEKKIKWTAQQLQAINARGRDVLVTASAGTGKTAVLSGRCLSILSEKVDIRDMLVLTFTEAAAEQMRSRIAEQLKEASKQSSGSGFRYQLILLQAAEISTIHSFCKRTITEYFYEINLDPAFRVIDEDQQKLLKAEVLDKTIEYAWQQDNIRDALKELLYNKKLDIISGFPSVIIRLSEFLDSVVSRDNWYERALRLNEILDPYSTKPAEQQKKIIAGRLSDTLEIIRHAQRLSAKENTGSDWSLKWETEFIRPVINLLELINAGKWKEFNEQFIAYPGPPRSNKPSGLSDLSAEIIETEVKYAKAVCKGLSGLALLNPDYLEIAGRGVSIQAKVLIELLKIFDRLYSQAKREINSLDFADLEHYALKLLTKKTGEPEPSDTALALRKRYRHIFVDEYQDINSVQRQIIEMLSPGGNVLHVGDVKQSIYAFRGSDPEIFIEQLKSAMDPALNVDGGLLVELNTNFRSIKGILDFANKIFSRIMSADFGGLDYDQSNLLRPPDSDSAGNIQGNPVVELHILDQEITDKDTQDENSNNEFDRETTKSEGDENQPADFAADRRLQAAMIAQRIRQITGADSGKAQCHRYDKDNNSYRNVMYGDIVILMRSIAGRANDYVEILRLAGIPVSCSASEGYFQTTEITDSICLLKVLDNPRRDIELAAVLRSPFFGISDTELAKIKLFSIENNNNKGFYEAVRKYSTDGDDKELAERIKEILAKLEQWRSQATAGELSELIWRIYRQSGYLSFVSAQANGRTRRANLLKLHDRAIQFENFASNSGSISLRRFVDFLQDIQETGHDWSPAEPPGSAGNAVRIMSIHKSKGLEFPVVFLAELQSEFNKSDIRSDCLTDADYTLGLRITDRKTGDKISSLAHQVIAEKKTASMLAEELRILYVAATRASDKLILTGSCKQDKCRKIISNGYFFGTGNIAAWKLKSCKNPLEWILYALSDQKILHEVFNSGLAGGAADDKLFSFEMHNKTNMQRLYEFIVQQKNRKKSGASDLPKRLSSVKQAPKHIKKLKQSLSWEYPFGDISSLPAKQSVSELTHKNDEYIRFDYSISPEHQPIAVLSQQGLKGKKIDRRLLGSATHLVISHLDLTKPVNAEAVGSIKDSLVAKGFIAESVAAQIDTLSIVAFFKSSPGRAALNSDNSVYREWPFTFALPAAELQNTGDKTADITDEFVVVQGIIDMLICTPGGLIVVDFKTDNVTAEYVRQRADIYSRQLELYAHAASEILKKKTIEKWLYFLSPAVEYHI